MQAEPQAPGPSRPYPLGGRGPRAPTCRNDGHGRCRRDCARLGCRRRRRGAATATATAFSAILAVGGVHAGQHLRHLHRLLAHRAHAAVLAQMLNARPAEQMTALCRAPRAPAPLLAPCRPPSQVLNDANGCLPGSPTAHAWSRRSTSNPRSRCPAAAFGAVKWQSSAWSAAPSR